MIVGTLGCLGCCGLLGLCGSFVPRGKNKKDNNTEDPIGTAGGHLQVEVKNSSASIEFVPIDNMDGNNKSNAGAAAVSGDDDANNSDAESNTP
jgi:hypothetical protein